MGPTTIEIFLACLVFGAAHQHPRWSADPCRAARRDLAPKILRAVDAAGWSTWDDEDEPETDREPDGECFRGGEAAAFEREQMDAARRLK